MKKHLKGFVVGFLIAAILSGITVFALSDVVWKKIEVSYAGYKIYVDGVEFTPKDKYGYIEPFAYNEWIYAPFEHIAKALGKEAYWDQNTRTLYLGRRPGSTGGTVSQTEPFLDVVPAYESHYIKTLNSVTMVGKKYSNALTATLNYSECYSFHNLDGKYKQITGYIGHIDGEPSNPGTINFYGDGKILDSYDLKSDDMPKKISINVVGVTQFKIEFPSRGSSYAFADITIE